jgi:hypothetical protein
MWCLSTIGAEFDDRSMPVDRKTMGDSENRHHHRYRAANHKRRPAITYTFAMISDACP